MNHPRNITICSVVGLKLNFTIYCREVNAKILKMSKKERKKLFNYFYIYLNIDNQFKLDVPHFVLSRLLCLSVERNHLPTSLWSQ